MDQFEVQARVIAAALTALIEAFCKVKGFSCSRELIFKKYHSMITGKGDSDDRS